MILNTRGEPVSGVSVRVVTFPVTADATIYSDDGITQTTNPLTTDANGRFQFYAADGHYSLQLSGAGITSLTVSDILMQDAVAAATPESLFRNLSLQFSVAANALTVALKTSAGANPSTASPVRIAFRNATAATGDETTVAVTTATSVTVSSGSTLGVVNNNGAFRIWIVAFNDSGTVRLGVINCVPDVYLSIYPLGQLPIASSTAEGGAGAADSAKVFYTNAAVTAKAYTVLGYATYDVGLAAVGAWATTPTKVQIFGPGVPLPGAVVQSVRVLNSVVGTGTTTIPSDNTIPQVTEGDEWANLTITPSSPANLALIEGQVNCATSNVTAGTVLTSALFDNLGANAKAATAEVSEAAGRLNVLHLRYQTIFGVTVTLTISARVGASAAGTTTLNGTAGAQLYGGVFHSYLEAREVMG